MCKCLIVGENQLHALIKRYDGIGKPLTPDETQILLAALSFESAEKGGMVADAQREYLKRK